jgi:hypothetical protein
MCRNLFWLGDEQWGRIKPHLPTDLRGVARVDDRRVLSGIVHVLKSDCIGRPSLPDGDFEFMRAPLASRGLSNAVFAGIPCERGIRTRVPPIVILA